MQRRAVADRAAFRNGMATRRRSLERGQELLRQDLVAGQPEQRIDISIRILKRGDGEPKMRVVVNAFHGEPLSVVQDGDRGFASDRHDKVHG